jgi:hypothetical protein
MNKLVYICAAAALTLVASCDQPDRPPTYEERVAAHEAYSTTMLNRHMPEKPVPETYTAWDTIEEYMSALSRVDWIWRKSDSTCLYELNSGHILLRVEYEGIMKVTGYTTAHNTVRTLELKSRDTDNDFFDLSTGAEEAHRWRTVEAVLCPGDEDYQQALFDYYVPDMEERLSERDKRILAETETHTR